ncbi:MAG TPA: ComF family protein [Pseudonocardiaceae bacterium]|jgi:predicted amidophosphoribosyltransferase|nr:ComF family protein [Pseudonocardiaceae bacterium]
MHGTSLCVPCACSFDGPTEVRRQLLTDGPPTHALGAYRDSARTTVLSFKERGRRDLAQPLGRILAAVLPTLDDAEPHDGVWWLVPAPSRPSAARRRGGSHMLALARATAAALAVKQVPAVVAPALRLARGTKDSAGLSAVERIENLRGRVKVDPRGAPPPGTTSILLDDVVTTGATVVACRDALQSSGIEVSAALTLTAT